MNDSRLSHSDAIAMALLNGHTSTAAVLVGYAHGGAASAYGRWKGILSRAARCDSAAAAQGDLIQPQQLQHRRSLQWLTRRKDCCTPLHCLEGMSVERAQRLLRSGADLHAHADGRADAPSPLEVARALLANASPPHRTPTDAASSPSAPPLGAQKKDAEAEVVGITAARLVVAAAGPWQPATHALYPDAVRARVVQLLIIGTRLSRIFGGNVGSYALVELWIDCVLPRVGFSRAVPPHPALAHPQDENNVRVS